MKVEIDLDDIMADSDGYAGESVAEGVRRLVVEKLTQELRDFLSHKIDAKLSDLMDSEISKAVQERLPGIIEDIMNSEYTPITSYGVRGAPTTFRKELVKIVVDNLVYKPQRYSADENLFTKSVKAIIDAKTAAVTKEITATVDSEFAKEALRAATEALARRLNVKPV